MFIFLKISLGFSAAFYSAARLKGIVEMSCDMPSITINSIILRNTADKICFNPDDIVLLVGANNVGKSRFLKDLKEDIVDNTGPGVLVDKVEYNSRNFNEEQIRAYFRNNLRKNSSGNYCITVDTNQTYCFSSYEFENISQNEKTFYKTMFSFLSTESRLDITRPLRFDREIDRNAYNIVVKLDDNPEAMRSLNEALAAGFNKSVDVYTDLGDDPATTMYKIGDYQDLFEALSLNKPEWKNRMKKLECLHDQGDGVRSAVAILASLVVSDHSLFLIDEPETFLHPPQAKMIGKSIVDMSRGKQCFIATHNIDFIKGVLEADSSRVKIIKIDRDGYTNSYNIVDNESISEIATDKNLKYTNILDGLFYDKVVLCEDETDCKFYAAILERVDSTRYQDTLFCAVGGKHQLKKVIPLLKRLHIQNLTIVDIDLVNSQDDLKQLLDAVEPNCYESIKNDHRLFLDTFEKESGDQVKKQIEIRNEINKVFNNDTYMSKDAVDRIKEILKRANNISLIKRGGKQTLPHGNCVTCFNRVNECLEGMNIYIVGCGEIEGFVPDVSGHGNKWLEKVFEMHPDIDNDVVYNEAKTFINRVFGNGLPPMTQRVRAVVQ